MMMQDRRAAARAYKERKRRMGVFAVHCTVIGRVWVGASRNLDTQQNPIWFCLKLGSHRCRDMQAAWDAYGAASFAYEVLAELAEAELAFPETRLKALTADWMQRLDAAPVTSS